LTGEINQPPAPDAPASSHYIGMQPQHPPPPKLQPRFLRGVLVGALSNTARRTGLRAYSRLRSSGCA
jgi:hypothetical protein